MTSGVVVFSSEHRVSSDGSEISAAAELVSRIVTEQPVVAQFPEREQTLLSAWLTGLRSKRTRRAYACDAAGWLGWCAARGVDALTATRVHVDMWVLGQLDSGAENSSVRRRLSAVSSLYKYCAGHDLIARIPTEGVKRPHVDPDYTGTVSLNRDESRALIAAADAGTSPQQKRDSVIIRLLLHNGLRVDELCKADLSALGVDRGHQVLTVTRKGGKRCKAPLAPATALALQAYLYDRASVLGGAVPELAGPLIATSTGSRLDQSALLKLVKRLAKVANISSWQQLSPHSLRHASITHFLDAGGTLRDAQDHAGHADPRTTRRYDHSRHSLDRAGSYVVAAYLAE